MIKPATMKRLDKVFSEATRIKINENDKFIIFSDLHMGNGGFNDDFARNALLFSNILRNYYLKRNYKLILNGDIEELYKFSLKKISKAWSNIYNLFEEFNKTNSLYKLFGNHDYELALKHDTTHHFKLHQALRLDYNSNDILVYHGHQTANKLEQYSKFVHYMVRYFFRTVGNTSVPLENDKKYETEEIAYEFSTRKKIISLLGHTHRPLFESMSKIESLKLLIENLISKYESAQDKVKWKIELQIKKYKNELYKLYEKNKKTNLSGGIYNNRILLPCLFNSGSVTGKRGITGIEIKNGFIYLVYWFDRNRSTRYLHYKDVNLKQFGKSDYFKAIIKKEKLDYIFNRIKLLS